MYTAVIYVGSYKPTSGNNNKYFLVSAGFCFGHVKERHCNIVRHLQYGNPLIGFKIDIMLCYDTFKIFYIYF